MLKQDITKKEQIDKNVIEFEAGNEKKYKMERIWNNVDYAKELTASYLSSFYYLIFWKDYSKKENI